MRKMDGEPPLKLYGDCKRPYPNDYRPAIDASDELDAQGIHRFQELIGILRWAVKLVGRVDIMTEVSCLSQHCSPSGTSRCSLYEIPLLTKKLEQEYRLYCI
jgi:hypothetical protein